jgi:hypothetical protein
MQLGQTSLLDRKIIHDEDVVKSGIPRTSVDNHKNEDMAIRFIWFYKTMQG